MEKKELLDIVKKMIDSGCCCQELKEKANAYLSDQNTAHKEALIAELKEDVCSIDDYIAFLSSDRGHLIFGFEIDAMIRGAKRQKAEGQKYCICPACQNGAILLAHADEL